ncbi:AAA family ATPase [Ruania alba]|uniref:AAA family ATPase n=1 Tax=Ruania alba TaxID=648782 RepID=UPI001587311D|nr:AAA family ATPase [Ruania alba]
MPPGAASPAAAAPVQIGLLDRLSVCVNGVDVTPQGPTQQRLVIALAVAALHEQRPSVDELVDAVYGEELPPRPRRSVATLVWRLRKTWGTEAISSDPYGYWLVAAWCSIDVREYEGLLQRGHTLARDGDRTGAVAALTQALSTWPSAGEPRAALPPAEAERFTELRLGAMERLGELLSGTSRRDEAIRLLEHVTTERPAWEHSQALLIGCYLDLGNRADANRSCDRARRALIDQGVEPGPELSGIIARLGRAESAEAPSAARPVEPAGQVLEPEPLIGRSRDLEAVSAAVRTAIQSTTPSVVAVSGEAGIGKSALVRAVLARFAEEGGPRALTLQCDPRRTLPYAVFAPLAPPDDQTSPLSRLLRGDALADPAASIDLLHTALSEQLRSIADPTGLVLVVEDLHWAPPATVEAVAALLGAAHTSALAVLITTRTRTLPDQLTRWVQQRTRLSGLSIDAVAQLIGSENDPALAVDLRRRTGGNPLYVRQLHQTGHIGTSDLPDDLKAAIDAHLQLIPDEVLDTLRVASAVGDTFTLVTLAALPGEIRQDLPTWRGQLATAASHGLVRADPGEPGRYDFVHTLIREHLYDQIEADHQTRIHAAIGRALQRLALSRPCPADILAHHYVRGWPETSTDEVVDTLTAAAQAASAQLDFTQAAAHYRAALDHLAMDPQREQDTRTAQLLGAAAGACAAAGQLHMANELYQSQLRLADATGMIRWRLFAALGILRTQYTRRVGPEVTDHLVAAVSEACASGELAALPELVGEALAAIQVYRPARAAELLDSTCQIAPVMRGRFRLEVWEHQAVPDQLLTARALVEDDTADPIGSWLRLWVSEVAAGMRAIDDQPPCPVPLNDADDQTRFDLTQWRITTMIAAGDVGRAYRLIDEALAAPRHPDPAENARRAASFYGQRTYLALLTGDLDAAQQSPLLAHPTWASRHPIMRYVAAYLPAVAGAASARELCADLVEEIRDEIIPDSDIVPRLLLLAGTCRRTEHRAGLEVCLEHLQRHRGEHGIFRFGQYWGSADGTIGDLHVALGDLEAAIEAYQCAIAGYEIVHAYRYLPSARRALARTLERLGRPTASGHLTSGR